MASIEEDEDLIALRSAVLASMKVKPKEKEPLEEDAELLALRQAALQSKRQQHSTVPDGSNHAQHLAIAKVQRIALPFSPASPKQFQSASQGWNNLIVIPLQEEQASPRQPLPPKVSSHKPTLLLPQDKWVGGSTSGATGSANAAAATKEKKASSKFSRFESHDSDSEEEDEEDEDKNEEVDLLEKQIEQFLQGSSDQEDSGNENDRSPAGGTDSDHSGEESPAVKSENDHSVGDSPRAGSDGDGQCSGIEPEAEQSEQNLTSVKCCDKNSVDDLALESTDKGVHSRSPSRARSSSSSSSGSSSSSHSSGSSSSWSSSWSSGSRSQSVSPDRHKSAISAGKQKESCDAKTVVKSTARGPPRPSGEWRTHKSNWEHAADSRSGSLKVGSDRRSPYSDERQWGRRDMKQSTRTEPQGEMPSRKHPRDRLGHRAAPNLDAAKDAREKLEDRKRKFASSKTIQSDKRGTTIVLKSAMPSGKVATDKENRQSNVKLRLGTKKYGSHSGKDDRMQTGGTNPGNTKPEPLTKVKERVDSFKSDDLSDSSDLFSFSDSDSDDTSSAPWRQKNTIERDETQINQERYIRRRNDRCIDGVVVAPRGGARVQNLRHTGRRRRQAPPRARHLKPRADPGWTAHHKDSGSEGEMREKDRRSLRSVMSFVKKNTNSADSSRSRSSSGNRDHKWRKRKDDLVVVDVHLDEPSKSVVVREESSLQTKGKASREEDARSIIQRLKRKGGPVEVEVELAVKEVKKVRKSPPVVARVSPTINITFNKDAELPKSDARMSVHERLGVPRKSRHSKATPPPLATPPKPISRQLESRVDVARKVVRYDDHSDDNDNSHRGTNGSRLMKGKASVTRKHQVAAPVEKEMYSKKKTLLVLKTAGRRDCHEPETRQRIKPDHDDPEKIADKKPTGHYYESELDARIQKIKEKNDQIMRRKQQIEDDKKKYG